MNKMLLMLYVSLCTMFFGANAQMRSSTPPTDDQHMRAAQVFHISKKQKITAWILLGSRWLMATQHVARVTMNHPQNQAGKLQQ